MLNVYPLLCLALNNIYAKLKGKDQDAKVWANMAMREDLGWAKKKVAETDGMLLLKLLSWETSACTCMLETDACPDGYVYWYPSTKQDFATQTLKGTPAMRIILFEALAVLLALYDAHH